MNILLAHSIDRQLEQVEELLGSQFEGYTAGVAKALYRMLTAGGKRLRPRLALLVGNLLGADSPKLLNLAAAIEMLHTATLVHDDLIDNSLLRRGNATLNAHYSPAVTVLAGDFAFARSASLAAETGSQPVMRLFAETLTRMTMGELTQASAQGRVASREAYFQWIHAKTAALFELTTGAAALISPADEKVVTAARQFGYQIGMAFQIVDDILDFTGEAGQLGKPTGSDLRQGVITLPTLCYLESHPGYRLSYIHDQFNHQERDQAWLDQLVANIRENGAIHQARQVADGFVTRGLECLAALPASQERQALEEITRAILHRSK